MMPLRPASSDAGVSLGSTSAYTPRSRTLRAMRWQYCPPASRTVIWGMSARGRVRSAAGTVVVSGKPLLAIRPGRALDDQLFRLVQQRVSFRHRVNRLQHHRVAFDGHLLRLFVAERRGVHLFLELLLDPLVVLGQLRFGEGDVLLE